MIMKQESKFIFTELKNFTDKQTKFISEKKSTKISP